MNNRNRAHSHPPSLFRSQNDATGTAIIQPPVTPGPYRLTVWISDGAGKIATASFPFNATTTWPPVTLPVYADAYIVDAPLLTAGPSAGAFGPAAYQVRAGPMSAKPEPCILCV